MFNLVFNVGVGFCLSVVLLVFAKEKNFREIMKGWFSLSSEQLFKACVVAIPAILIAVGFQTFITSGRPLKLLGPQGMTIGLLLAICFLFPVVEEWARAMIMIFCKECGSALLGLILSAIYFALLHSLGLDLIWTRAFAFALLSGLLTLWSKGIGPSILVHILTNVVLVSLVAV